ncbi:MAG: hypothetical protein V4629_11130 [Pseudomonadota bacterium]
MFKHFAKPAVVFSKVIMSGAAILSLGCDGPSTELKDTPQNPIIQRAAETQESTFMMDPKSSENSSSSNTADFEGAALDVIDSIKNNAIAGKKFVSAVLETPETLVITFDNFPMSQMPPFVKEKFTSGISERAFTKDSKLKTVVLFDQGTQAQLERIVPSSATPQS